MDLQSDEGAALVGGQWRYADARVEEIDCVELAGQGAADPLGPGDVPNRTHYVVPHAEATDFDDSPWATLAPADTMRRLSTGRVCFNWYRVEVTIPERVGALDPTGARVVFEVVVTTTPRSGSTGSCRSPWARPAARSWPASTCPIASC